MGALLDRFCRLLEALMVLLLFVGSAALYVCLQGVAIVSGSDGKVAIVIGKNASGGSPFDLAENPPETTAVTTAVRQPSSQTRRAGGRDASVAATGSPATATTGSVNSGELV